MVRHLHLIPLFPLLPLFPLFLFGLILSGCGGGGGIPADPGLAPVDEVATAILQGEDLARFIEIQDQGYSYDNNSIFLAETLIYNRAQESVALEVRTLFKNAQGHTLTTSPWKKITIGPGQRHIHVAPSPSVETNRFITQIRKFR